MKAQKQKRVWLTDREARVLHTILYSGVGGTPYTYNGEPASPRGVMDGLRRKLAAAGARPERMKMAGSTIVDPLTEPRGAIVPASRTGV